ncbi:hypothetical protein KQI65_01545 [bacterium]|nr:hypothetical protein [bacterium]
MINNRLMVRAIAFPALASALAVALLLSLPACSSQEEKGPVTDTTMTTENGEIDVTPVQPDEGLRVDIGRWYESTLEDFGNKYVSFSAARPVVHNYGICDSVEVFFPDESADALPEILICHLNGIYTVENAFSMLGIATGAVADSEGQWISLESMDERFAGLKFQGLEGYPDRTTQLLLQFDRSGEE